MKKLSLLFLIAALLGANTFAADDSATPIAPDTGVSHFFDIINPFWTMPEIDDGAFRFTLELPVKNDGYSPFVPTGKIYLTDADGNPIEWVGVIGASDTSSGKLVDYIPFNALGSAVEPWESKIFQIVWRGFGDQYITDGSPVLVFRGPRAHYDTEDYNINFWEKFVLGEASRNFPAHAEIEYVEPLTQAIITQEQLIQFSVRYPILVRTLNTGLILVFALLILIVLLMLFFRKTPPRPTARSTGQNFDEIEFLMEAEAAKIDKKKTSVKEKKSPVKKSAPKKAPAKKSSTKPTPVVVEAPTLITRNIPIVQKSAAKKPVAKKVASSRKPIAPKKVAPKRTNSNS